MKNEIGAYEDLLAGLDLIGELLIEQSRKQQSEDEIRAEVEALPWLTELPQSNMS